MKPFGYLHDRLFQVSLALYAVNRLLLKSHLGFLRHTHFNFVWSFSHSHFDDVLLMPVALPVVLWVQRQLGVRPHDSPPGWLEMAAHMVVWSVICKGVGPLLLHVGTCDPWDLLAFIAGGLAACWWWRRPVESVCAASPHEL